MLTSYLLSFKRQLIRFRSTYAVNVIGLTFGLFCCILCFQYVHYQHSFDNFHPDSDRLYRLVKGDPSFSDHWVKMSPPISPKLKDEIPEIEDYARLTKVTFSEKVMVEADNHFYLEPSFMMADPSFLRLFHFEMEQGLADNALTDKNGVAISHKIAQKLFGNENPVGKIIRLRDNQLEFEVKGVFKDLPSNTHLMCDYLISYDNLEKIFGEGTMMAWGQFNYFTYLKLRPMSDVQSVEKKIQSISFPLANGQKVDFNEFHLQPVPDIHFQYNRGNLLPSYDIRYTYIFVTLSISVLVIWLMNYFNVSAILSIKRRKEIGVRKSIGATNKQLTLQFLSEGCLMSFSAVTLAFLFVELVKPFVSDWFGDSPGLQQNDSYQFIFATAFMIALLLASSSYISMYISRFTAGMILKGSANSTGSGLKFQNILIFIQCSVSLILLICTVVIVRQLNFLKDRELGFDKDQVVHITLPGDVPMSALTALKSELLKRPQVQDVAFSDFIPGNANWHQSVWWEGQTDTESMFIIAVDRDFISAMGMKLVEGSIKEIQSSTQGSYVLNESAVRLIGWETAKGKQFSPFGEKLKNPITAVVKDFNYRSLHNEIAPLVLVIYPERQFSELSIRLSGGDVKSGVQAVEQCYKLVMEGLPFEFSFLDDRIDLLYESEARMEKIIVVLTVISVCFGILGIYIMISFAIENRTKEVAIRKVLGISTDKLLILFTGSYFKIIILSSVIGVPVSWHFLNAWLSTFNQHVQPGFMNFVFVIFLLMGLVCIVGIIKLFTIQAINPVDSLKGD